MMIGRLLIFCLGVMLFGTSCITISSPAWKVYDQISDMSDKKLLKEGCNLYSFGGLGEEGWKELRLGFFVDEDKVTHVSIDEARVLGVNLFLELLNFVNDNPKFLKYSPSKGLTEETLDIHMFFGIFRSPDNTGVESMGITKRKVRYTLLGPPEERREFESLSEAIKIVQEQGLLEHPEYLKWVVNQD